MIYKIMTVAEWSAFQDNGYFAGSEVDLSDGFIHFSTADQMVETAARHFAGQDDLMLVWGDARGLRDSLRWEVSRGGAEFPHLYRDWMLTEVVGHARLPWDGAAHVFPDGHL